MFTEDQDGPFQSESIERVPWRTRLFPPGIRGVEHEPGRKHAAYWLAASLVALAIFGMAPAMRHVWTQLLDVDSLGVRRWAYLAIVIGFVQIVYAAYLAQLPDWSSVWVIAIVTLLIAAGYAVVLSVTVLSGSDNDVVRVLQLAELAERLPREPFSRASMWCFIMLSTSGLLTYFAGRVGLRWHHAQTILARATSPQVDYTSDPSN